MTAHTADAAKMQRRGASGLDEAAWVARLDEIGRGHGFCTRIGTDHLALFVQEGDTLVVSFDSAARVFTEEQDGLPPGFEAVRRHEWSLLSILSLGDPWFRSADLAGLFDRLGDEGFFDSFETVVFLGFGAANGHAACVFSAAAPGSSVLASAPVATLDPARAGFDRRFPAGRRLPFVRYGDAPAQLASARAAVILHDPTDPVTGAHAAQFRGPGVTLAPLRFAGPAPHRLIAAGGLLVPILRALAQGRLTRAGLARMIRPVRRADAAYLWRLARIAQAQGKPARARLVAEYAADVTGEARFVELAARLSHGPA